MDNAIELLEEVGALNKREELTALGKKANECNNCIFRFYFVVERALSMSLHLLPAGHPPLARLR